MKMKSLDNELGISNYLLGDIEKLSNKRRRLFMMIFLVVMICMAFILLHRFILKI